MVRHSRPVARFPIDQTFIEERQLNWLVAITNTEPLPIQILSVPGQLTYHGSPNITIGMN